MKIFFAWETGAGMGHLLPHRKLLGELQQRGHEIHVAGREVSRVARAFSGLPIKIWQAPFHTEPPFRVKKPTFTFGHVLHNSGFETAESLSARCKAWDSVLDAVNPEVVMTEYAPTLLVAVRGRHLKVVVLGNGFGSPPPGDHLPIFSVFERGVPPDTLESDAALLKNINKVLRARGQASLAAVNDVFNDETLVLLKTLPELDHYEERRDARYMGAPEPPPGAEPKWIAGDGPRVFAYLKPSPGLPTALGHLYQLGWPSIVVSDGLTADIRQRFSTGKMLLTDVRMDLKKTAEGADIAISNANIGTCSHFLMKGVPVLNLPLTLEQQIVSKRMTDAGTGESINPATGSAATIALKRLAENASYRQAALAFAERHKEYSLKGYEERVFEELEGYAGL